jgi:hypothetical protein
VTICDWCDEQAVEHRDRKGYEGGKWGGVIRWYACEAHAHLLQEEKVRYFRLPQMKRPLKLQEEKLF